MRKTILINVIFVLSIVLLIGAILVAYGKKVSSTSGLPSYWASCQVEQQRYSQEPTENLTIAEIKQRMHRMSTCLDEIRAMRNGKSPSKQDKISDGQFMLEFYRAAAEFDNRVFQQQLSGAPDGL